MSAAAVYGSHYVHFFIVLRSKLIRCHIIIINNNDDNEVIILLIGISGCQLCDFFKFFFS